MSTVCSKNKRLLCLRFQHFQSGLQQHLRTCSSISQPCAFLHFRIVAQVHLSDIYREKKNNRVTCLSTNSSWWIKSASLNWTRSTPSTPIFQLFLVLNSNLTSLVIHRCVSPKLRIISSDKSTENSSNFIFFVKSAQYSIKNHSCFYAATSNTPLLLNSTSQRTFAQRVKTGP